MKVFFTPHVSANLIAECQRASRNKCVIIELPPDVLDKFNDESARGRVVTGTRRPVRVVAVDDEVARSYQPPYGRAQLVHVGQRFASGAIASKHLGLAATALSLRMCREKRAARRRGVPYNGRVVLRGITLEYSARRGRLLKPKELPPPAIAQESQQFGEKEKVKHTDQPKSL
jgi:hypothetical protein